jgi:geranylgeranyl pyrophosphate synthase
VNRLQLTIALDQNFNEKELHKIAESLGGAFELKDRVYMLKSSEESPPTAVFALGQVTKDNLPYILGVIKSEYWKKAKKEIAQTLGKRRKDEDPLISFECSFDTLKANIRCRSSDRKVIETAFEHLDLALESLWTLIQKKDLPSTKAQVYLGFHEPTKIFRIDRLVVLGREFAEYEYDEKKQIWSQIPPGKT